MSFSLSPTSATLVAARGESLSRNHTTRQARCRTRPRGKCPGRGCAAAGLVRVRGRDVQWSGVGSVPTVRPHVVRCNPTASILQAAASRVSTVGWGELRDETEQPCIAVPSRGAAEGERRQEGDGIRRSI
jgi:hypothetical protein